MKIGLGYIRQSRHRTTVRTVSPETQEAAISALPEMRACDRVEFYRDLDRSGQSVERRKGYQALYARIEAEVTPGDVIVVAAYNQARTGRNKLDALRLWALIEVRPWIEVVFVEGGKLDRSNSGELTWAIRAAVAEYEAKQAGAQIAANMRYSISRGEMVGPVPLGYRRVREGRDVRIEIEPAGAAVVKRMFEEYATGKWSCRLLAVRLNDEGIRPPGFNHGIRADTLAQILSSPAYIGLMREGGRRQRSGALVAGQWPALIDQATWDTVQSLMSRWARRGGGAPKRLYAFQRLLRCGGCGATMYVHAQLPGTYYRCRATGADVGCGRGVREDRILPWGRALMEWLEGAAARRGLGAVVEEGVDRSAKGARPIDAIAQVDRTLERIGQRFEWGEFTEGEYRAKRAHYLALRAEFERQAAAQETPRLVLTGVLQAWDTGDAMVRRQLLWALFEELDVLDDAIIAAQPRAEVAAEVALHLEGWPGYGARLRLRFGEGAAQGAAKEASR